MKVYTDLTPAARSAAVALGNFDGVHLGHQRVISLAVKERENGLMPTVLTFAEKSLPGGAESRLLSRDEKLRLLEGLGVEQLYLLDFQSVKGMPPEEFVGRVLTDVCRAKKACCGFNFTFGRGGRAGSEELSRLCAAQGIVTEIADAVLFEGAPVSSTRIRALIAEGEVGKAAEMLGRPFAYESEVVRGKQLGRTLGVPTLNQAVPEEFVLPKFGVYASTVTLPDGSEQLGVTNVGMNPTVGSDRVLAETWMPDYAGPDLYGAQVKTALFGFLRPEVKFETLEELRVEMVHDGERAGKFFRENSLKL